MSIQFKNTEQTKVILGLKLYWKYSNITILIRNIENNQNNLQEKYFEGNNIWIFANLSALKFQNKIDHFNFKFWTCS